MEEEIEFTIEISRDEGPERLYDELNALDPDDRAVYLLQVFRAAYAERRRTQADSDRG